MHPDGRFLLLAAERRGTFQEELKGNPEKLQGNPAFEARRGTFQEKLKGDPEKLKGNPAFEARRGTFQEKLKGSPEKLKGNQKQNKKFYDCVGCALRTPREFLKFHGISVAAEAL